MKRRIPSQCESCEADMLAKCIPGNCWHPAGGANTETDAWRHEPATNTQTNKQTN